MNTEQLQLMMEWDEARKDAAIAKKVIEREQELRKKVVASLFPDPREGVNTIELNGGWKLKYTHKIDYKVDEAVLISTVVPKLAEVGKSADDMFKYTPSLMVKEYKALDDNVKSIVNLAVTIKPGSPTMELAAPKG